MFISFTTSKATPEQAKAVRDFLAGFLPRMEREAGALAAYHFDRPDRGDDITIVIWPSREVAMKYREGELINEVRTFEETQGLLVTREGYELSYPPAIE
jgi:quinol monooxygenase YgiN